MVSRVNLHSKDERPVHGGLNYAELESLGLRPEEVTDFSASINPLGPSRVALEAARQVNLAAYPDPDCLDLRRAIGNSLGVDPGYVLPGNGSTELIHLLAPRLSRTRRHRPDFCRRLSVNMWPLAAPRV